MSTKTLAPSIPAPVIADPARPDASADSLSPSTPQWSFATRLAFRFAFIYFILFCLSNQIFRTIFKVPGIVTPSLATLWPLRLPVIWVAHHIFAVRREIVYTGISGDKTFNWVLYFCLLVVAGAGCAVWSVRDRARLSYPSLARVSLLLLRVALAGQMLAYGMFKVIPLQMSSPYLMARLEPFGNMFPVNILWSSIGAAPAYEIFVGCAEVLAGLLLAFPRTVTLGALICLGDAVEIFALNMTYDVAEKLLSFHLILMSLLLLLPDMRRLADFFFFNRATAPVAPAPLFPSRRAHRAALALAGFLWLWMLGNDIGSSLSGWKWHEDSRSRSALYGIWDVDRFTLDGQDHPPLLTDEARPRRLVFEFPDSMVARQMNDSIVPYTAAIDQKSDTLALTQSGDKSFRAAFTYSRPAPDRLLLDGTMAGHQVQMQLERIDQKDFIAFRRGIHWIQDHPQAR